MGKGNLTVLHPDERIKNIEKMTFEKKKGEYNSLEFRGRVEVYY